jgi:hypothetical protein
MYGGGDGGTTHATHGGGVYDGGDDGGVLEGLGVGRPGFTYAAAPCGTTAVVVAVGGAHAASTSTAVVIKRMVVLR